MCVAAEEARHVVSDQVQRSKESKVSAAEQVVSGQCSGVSGQRSVQWSKESKVSAAKPVVGDQSGAAEQVTSGQCSGVNGQKSVQWSKESKVSVAEPVVGDWQRDWCVGNYKDCTKRISKNVNSGSIFPENKL